MQGAQRLVERRRCAARGGGGDGAQLRHGDRHRALPRVEISRQKIFQRGFLRPNHALVTRHYFRGAYYPVGGAAAFARALVPEIERAGGAVRVNAHVQALIVEDEAVVGVRLADASELRAPKVFSAIGARNTVELLPQELRRASWATEVLSFSPSVCHVALYLGLEGDIRSCGATAANHWFHANWNVDPGVWRDPAGDPVPPVLFVSFPTLKDPSHDPGGRERHCAEIVAMCAWEPFASWRDSTLGHRPPEYEQLKSRIEQHLLAQFARHFPALASMVVARETSTPLTTAAYIGSQQGAAYGIEVSPRRFLSDALRPKTPVPGLFLAGQDVVTPGVMGAMMGGVVAACAAEPKLVAHLP